MNKLRKLKTAAYAVACIPVVLVALAVGTGNAQATTPGGSVSTTCAVDHTDALVTVSNTGFWWGISSDMVITESNLPGLDVGHHVVMGTPFTTHIRLTSSTTWHIEATWPDVNDHVGTLDLSATLLDNCKPETCPPGTHQTGTTMSRPAHPVCDPYTTPTTEPPATVVPPAVVSAPPAAAVPTTPVVTG